MAQTRFNARHGLSVGTTPIDVIDSSGNLSITVPIANGGTGATSAGAALTALGAYPSTNPSGYITGISSGTVTTALGFTPESSANRGAANGYAPLDASSKIASTYLPSYVDDVLEYANLGSFLATGETGKIYVALDTNKCYRWSGSTYVYITSGAVDSVGGLTGVVTLTGLGLNNVTNESKATMFNNPTFTGTVNGIKPRVSSAATVTSPLVWNSTSFDQYALTGLANALTINADANAAPADGQKMLFRIKDNGTARALTWTTGSTNSFRVIGTTLPTTTVANKTVYVGCIYNVTDSRWDVVAVGQEA
jgi:hypothetical protein